MTTELTPEEKPCACAEKSCDCKEKEVHHGGSGGGGGSVYGLGMIGAWVYFFQGTTTWQEKAKAFGKGLVWPAFLVYELFTFLNKNKAA